MYLCILDRDGQILLHRNVKSRPEPFLAAVTPYREDLVVAVECIFTWYWLADLCAREGITFVLGHALYMKAIHGAKAKNDKIDSKKIAGGWADSVAAPAMLPLVIREGWEALAEAREGAGEGSTEAHDLEV